MTWQREPVLGENESKDVISISADIPKSTTLNDLADDFLTNCFEAERRYVAAGWFDPVVLHDAAYRHGIYGDRFADRRLGFSYSYLACCAERRIDLDVQQCLALAELQRDVSLDRFDSEWLDRLILDTDIEAGHVEHYARQVARLADVRDNAARYHLREFAKLCIDASTFRITVQRKDAIRMAPKARNYHGRKTRKPLTV